MYGLKIYRSRPAVTTFVNSKVQTHIPFLRHGRLLIPGMSSTSTLLLYVAPMSSSSCAMLVKLFPSTKQRVWGIGCTYEPFCWLDEIGHLTVDSVWWKTMRGWVFPEFGIAGVLHYAKACFTNLVSPEYSTFMNLFNISDFSTSSSNLTDVTLRLSVHWMSIFLESNSA